MTHHLISSFDERATQLAQRKRAAPKPFNSLGCEFCAILEGAPCYKVYEDDHVFAFLDILPASPGHTLVIPKAHYRLMSELPDELAAALGATLPKICRSVAKAMDQPAFNIVNNNIHAQVVHHVHLHIVPAPKERKRKSYSILPDQRQELDDDEGERISALIRSHIEQDRGPVTKQSDQYSKM